MFKNVQQPSLYLIHLGLAPVQQNTKLSRHLGLNIELRFESIWDAVCPVFPSCLECSIIPPSASYSLYRLLRAVVG